jgi:hypothetical protein
MFVLIDTRHLHRDNYHCFTRMREVCQESSDEIMFTFAIAPDPPLPRLNRAHERMTGVLNMPGGVFVLGIVATARLR